MLDGYGNTLWSSLDSHSSRLSSGYGTDWRETDFSYNRLDGGRTYSCSYTGTLEEPYMSAGVVQYYVYSEVGEYGLKPIQANRKPKNSTKLINQP